VEDSYAGTRGFEIGNIPPRRSPGTPRWRSGSTPPPVAVFADRIVGVVRDGRYLTVKPAKLMDGPGAREKTAPSAETFRGHGRAFQDLVYRDLVKVSERSDRRARNVG